jgi:hypothetical protein
VQIDVVYIAYCSVVHKGDRLAARLTHQNGTALLAHLGLPSTGKSDWPTPEETEERETSHIEANLLVKGSWVEILEMVRHETWQLAARATTAQVPRRFAGDTSCYDDNAVPPGSDKGPVLLTGQWQASKQTGGWRAGFAVHCENKGQFHGDELQAAWFAEKSFTPERNQKRPFRPINSSRSH